MAKTMQRPNIWSKCFNLSVQYLHTYYCGNACVLVHNSPIQLPPAGYMQSVVNGLGANPENVGIGIYHVPSGQTFMAPGASLNQPYGGGHLGPAQK